MPNIKSAKKRVLVIKKKTLRNQMVKSALKTEIKKYEGLVQAGNKAEAASELSVVVKKIDQAAAKGVINKNAASRKKSQLACKLNAMA